MTNLNADEVITSKHKRAFVQYGGPRPNNPVKYAGQDAQYLFIDGVSDPESGGVDPIFVPDHRRPGAYRLVGRQISPPDLANATLNMLEKHGGIPRQLLKEGCRLNVYELTGDCRDLSDFLSGWSDYILVYSNAIITDKDLGTRTSMDSDEAITDGISVVLGDIYPVGSLSFGQEAATLVDREVSGITYGSLVSCECDNSSEYVYACTKSSGAGSPGLPSELIYSVDGGDNWSEAAIDGIGATEDALAIKVVGQYLVILSDGDAYYYATINRKTGVPGTFTKVTTGIVAAGTPRDFAVLSPREVWFCGDGGYIYKSTNIVNGVSVISAGDATSENLARISVLDNTILTVGANGAVVISLNRGATFATTTVSPEAASLTACGVRDQDRFWVGSANGNLWYSLTQGESWTQYEFAGDGAGQVDDIVWVNDDVGFFAHQTAAPLGRLFATWNGGADWTSTSPRIVNLPTVDYVGRIAYPEGSSGIAANNIALAGLAGDGLDGFIVLGVAAVV